MQELADRVQKIEGAQKTLSYQAVQQWEKEVGGAAPKRKRLEAVAKALETDVQTLLGAPVGADLSGDEADLIEAYRAIGPALQGKYLAAIKAAIEAAEHAIDQGAAAEADLGNSAGRRTAPPKSARM